MMYLTLSADYLEFSLRDESAGQVSPGKLGLPDELVAELDRWNTRYQPVIPMGTAERQEEGVSSLIRELDQVGQELANRIAGAVLGKPKVRYYSEGWLKYLP